MSAEKLTIEQAIILTGFTGIVHCNFSLFHEDAERRLGRSIWTHEFGSKIMRNVLEDAYRFDFLSILPEGTSK